jgi:hypothetical protein
MPPDKVRAVRAHVRRDHSRGLEHRQAEGRWPHRIARLFRHWHHAGMRDWIRRRLPTEETLKAHPSLRWMGPLLRRPWLWRLSRRNVALGAGIGVFFGFMVPVLQIAGAAMLAMLLRANLPVAAFATLVSNPLTYAPIGLLAYQTGTALLGELPEPDAAQALAEATATPSVDNASWFERLQAIGKPLLLGLALFAVLGGIGTWAAVHLGWTLAVCLKRRRRRRHATSGA